MSRSDTIAAASMIKGVEKGKYLVFTSRDIRAGYFLQRYAPFAYNRVMRGLNAKFMRILAKVETTQKV